MSRHDWQLRPDWRLYFWPEWFARNIATGAALCASFEEGWDQCNLWALYHEHGYRRASMWRPGCELPNFEDVQR